MARQIIIKVGKMSRDGKYNQGYFRPQNPQKYLGDPNNIVYRSGWELKFMRWCDRTESVLEYGSEEFFIPYFDPTTSRVRRYFPDFIIKVREQSGEIKKYVIEVKPKRQTIPPVQTSKKRTRTFINEVKTYAMNEAKWKAAQEWCKDRMIEFKIITEDNLGIK
jgi:hypothetical protein